MRKSPNGELKIEGTLSHLGIKGDDGFSPIVTIEELEEGQYQITIEDAAGEQSIILKDGKLSKEYIGLVDEIRDDYVTMRSWTIENREIKESVKNMKREIETLENNCELYESSTIAARNETIQLLEEAREILREIRESKV